MTCELCGGKPDHYCWHRSSGRGWRTIDFCEACVDGVDWEVLPEYLESRVLLGNGHNLALMFATATPPMSSSDKEFLQNTHETGKKYITQLARYPNDPRALVSCRGDVQRICEQEGWGCEGLVNVKANDFGMAPPKPVDIDEALVQEYMGKEIERDPGAALMRRGDLREKVRNRIKPHWSKT